MSVVEVTSVSQYEELVHESLVKPVVMDFYAPWCGPCKALYPHIKAFAVAHQGNVVVGKCDVDLDELENVASQVGIVALPTVLVYRNKEPVHTLTGFKDLSKAGEDLQRACGLC
jgi:thioredoxin